MRRHIRGAGESFWQPKGTCPNDRGCKEGTVLDAARLVHRVRPVPEYVCDGRLWRGTGLLADFVSPVYALDPRVRPVADPGAGLALGMDRRGHFCGRSTGVPLQHAQASVAARQAECGALYYRAPLRHRRAVPGELAEEDGTARPEVVRTIRRKGANGSSVRPFHRRFRALRSRPTRRPSARRQTESLRRGSGPGGTARSVSVREARSSDTRPAKWEHAWFARQRRMRARTLLCRRDLGRRGKDVESATHLAKSCLYSDL